MSSSLLYAIYDYKHCPLNFDIITFLVIAEMERIHRKLDAIHVVFVPDEESRYPKGCTTVLGDASVQWRERRVHVESVGLIPACTGLSTFSSRQEAIEFLQNKQHLYPQIVLTDESDGDYFLRDVVQRWLDNYTGIDLPALVPSPVAASIVDTWLQKNCAPEKKIITVTFREYYRGDDNRLINRRNSLLDEWRSFLAGLDTEKYEVVILRDFYQISEPLPEGFEAYKRFDSPLLSLDMRVALYEAAYLNLMDNCGPMFFLVLSNTARYLMFKMCIGIDSEYVNTGEWPHLYNALWEIGFDFPPATPFQKGIWYEPNSSQLKDEFDSMIALIEGGTYSTTEAIQQYREHNRKQWSIERKSLRIIHRLLSVGQNYQLTKLLHTMLNFRHNQADLVRLRTILAAYYFNYGDGEKVQKLIQDFTFQDPVERLFMARVLSVLGNIQGARKLIDDQVIKTWIFSRNPTGKRSKWITAVLSGQPNRPIYTSGIEVVETAKERYFTFNCPTCGYHYTIGKTGMYLQAVVDEYIHMLAKPAYGVFCMSCFEEFRLQVTPPTAENQS